MPLDVMNWVNEGLTNINNVRKGKAKLFDTIGYAAHDDRDLAFMITDITNPKFGAVLNVNKKTFENLGEYVKTDIQTLLNKKVLYKNKDGKLDLYPFYHCGEVSDNLLKTLNKFNENPESFSLIDKVKLYEDFASMLNVTNAFYNAPYSKIQQLLKNEDVQEILSAHSKLPDLKQLEKLSTGRQRNVLVDLVNTCLNSGDRIYVDYPSGNKFSIIYHENGHLEHLIKIGEDKFLSMGKPEDCIKRFGKVSDITNDFINSKEKQQIANRVSNYAAKSPVEFVAETYRKLINNALGGKDQIPDDVMKLYNEYGGPAI